MIVLDTNVLSDLMRPSPSGTVVRWLDNQLSSNVALTTITVAEVLYGIERLPAGKRRSSFAEAAADLFENEFAGRILPFCIQSAACYASAEQQGRSVSMADTQIAAICITHNATLATRNIRDFENFPVALINPWHD